VHTEECRFHRACYNSATAGFIGYDDDDLYDRPAGKAAEEGRAGTFDFDSLPVRDAEDIPCICAAVPAAPSSVALPLNSSHEEKQPEPSHSSPPLSHPVVSAISSDDAHFHPRQELMTVAGFLGRAQHKCTRNSVVGSTPAILSNQTYKSQATQPRVAPHASEKQATQPRVAPYAIENQHTRMRRVPAFGPLTRVLSPIVSRAQWEIVVRSAFLAMLLSFSIVGSLLTVPLRH
jgi:hypothetical protein